MLYNKLAKKPNIFKSLTGLTVEEFDKLYNFVESEYPTSERKRLDRKNRKRAIGAGRDFNLSLKDRLMMFLMYYRLYPSYVLLGLIFNLDQSNVFRDIKYLEPLVKRCIPLPEKVHKRTKKITTIKELLELFPEAKAILDATEQEIPRPKNKRRRKSQYSGKKKRHTVKTQILVNKKGLILHKTKHRPGREHDYTICKENPPDVPEQVEIIKDLGYQGMEKDFPRIKSRGPIKKRRGRKLTKKQKRYNKKLSKERIIVEHTLSKVKKFNIIGQEFRNKLKTYDTKMSVAMGLVNFRSMLKDDLDVSGFVG